MVNNQFITTDNRRRRRGIGSACFMCLWGGVPLVAQANHYNMTQGVTTVSQAIYHLHMTIFWICVLIACAVFSVLIYALIHHRKSKGVKPAAFHENAWVEVVWTVIPFLILIGMAIPATRVLIQMNDSTEADINILVTGYQWKWSYAYLDEGIKFFSNLSTPQAQIHNEAPKGMWYLLEVDKPLVLPIHKKIRLLITSNDVNHSWWVPALGVKMDAIPGYVHETWTRIDKPGIYRGQCAELCGMGHAYMPIVVIAKTQADYQQWVQAQRTGKAAAQQKNALTAAKGQGGKMLPAWSLKTALAAGKSVYGMHCAVCHKLNGKGMPPAFPAIMGSAVATGPLTKHIDIILHGRPGTAMQAFAAQLTDSDIAAVITYQRNTWGNANQAKYGKQAGGLVTPEQIKQQRQE